MAIRIRADPHVPPRRRNAQLADPREDAGVLDTLAGVEIDEAATVPAALEARL
jgi:hypothetical protein